MGWGVGGLGWRRAGVIRADARERTLVGARPWCGCVVLGSHLSGGCRLGVVGFPFLSGLSLVALFFFCGVGVVDDEVVEAEGVGCFGGGDEAVDGLGVSGEGVGGCACPGGG